MKVFHVKLQDDEFQNKNSKVDDSSALLSNSSNQECLEVTCLLAWLNTAYFAGLFPFQVVRSIKNNNHDREDAFTLRKNSFQQVR
jgi:hypothetical protein